ncbi:MAG: haloacid dehalogenase [Chloroflexi bacterium]|nr:haloacid dehalogenase [Chloroflexota bacterium]
MGQEAQAHLSQVHQARELALPLARETVRLCANAIRALHRREFDPAEALLRRAQDRLAAVREALSQHRELYYAGYVEDAQKEYAEARATLAFLTGTALPTPRDLLVEVTPYLNGLAEAASELRRSILDTMRRGEFGPCEEWMEAMDEVCDLLATLDFPEAVTGGLRHTTDQLRAVVERTRGDLTMGLRQRALEQGLARHQERLDRSESP